MICDIEMPKYTGLDLLEWVREQGWQQEFIFLTCHERFSYAAQAIRYKAEAYLIKPINSFTAAWNEATFRYAAGNIVGEILFGTPSIARVLHYSRNDRVYVAAVADVAADNAEKCARAVRLCKSNLQCDMTAYLSKPCSILQLSDQRVLREQADLGNVVREIPVVQDASQLARHTDGIVLDTERLLELLRQGKSVETVNVMRETPDAAERGGQISAPALHGIQQDFMQIVFLYLAEAHVLAHELFRDENAKRPEEVCGNSVFDLVRGHYETYTCNFAGCAVVPGPFDRLRAE